MGCFANWISAFFNIFDNVKARHDKRLADNEKRLQELMASAQNVAGYAQRAARRADKITEDLRASEKRVREMREGL